MNKIVIVGKMNNQIEIDEEKIDINDSINNLPNDFIVDIMKEIINKSGCAEKKNYRFNRDFKDEIIRDVKGKVVYEESLFEVTVSRKTYNDTPLIECIIEYEDGESLLKNEYTLLFKSIYKFKIKIKDILKVYCKKIYWLVDDNNTKICTSSYLKIHEIENKFRQMLSLFMMKKCGDIYLNKQLEETYEKYCKFYNENGYMDFKDINSKLYNIEFSSLPEILKMTTPQVIINEKNNIRLLIEDISKELNNIQNITYSYNKIEKMKKQLSTILEKLQREDFIFDDEIQYGKSIISILGEDFNKQWIKLSGMRNMVMHNKPICDRLYDDITETCFCVNKKINECLDKINNYFYTKEEDIYDYLCQEEADIERYEFEFIEQERENVGIDFPLNEDYVLRMLAENEKPVQNLIASINRFDEIVKSYDEIIYQINELSDIIEIYSIEELKLVLQKNYKIISVCSEEVKACKEIEELNGIILRYILKGQSISDLHKMSELIEVQDFFSIDKVITIVDYYGNKYDIYFQGELCPENDNTDYIGCVLLRNNEVEKESDITIYYGDYIEEREGYIYSYSIDEISEIIIKVYEETMNEINWIKDKISNIRRLIEKESDFVH